MPGDLVETGSFQLSKVNSHRLYRIVGKFQRLNEEIGEVTFYHREFVTELPKSCKVLMVKAVYIYVCTICDDLSI